MKKLENFINKRLKQKEKKTKQKEAFTTVLQTSENWKQTSLNRFIDFLREMDSYFKRQKQLDQSRTQNILDVDSEIMSEESSKSPENLLPLQLSSC